MAQCTRGRAQESENMMPCSDGYSDAERYTELKIRLDESTRAACEMARAIRLADKRVRQYDVFPTFPTLSKGTRNWIKKHDAMDKRRLEEEEREKRRNKLKKRALSKLNPEERQALDIL